MIAHLLDGLRTATELDAPAAELDRHIGGVAALMENHFGYEERRLLAVLETLELDADAAVALGSLG